MVGTVREIHATETRPGEGRRSSVSGGVEGGMGKRKRGGGGGGAGEA